MDFATWMAFTAASLVLAVAPGPDNIFVLTQSAMYGKKSGITVVSGLCTGIVLNTLAVALGLAAIVAAFPFLFWTIKVAGACYLLYLAFMAWLHASDTVRTSTNRGFNSFQLWRRGVIMNLTNPKVQIFFLAFFPQFVKEGTTGWAFTAQMLVQGITFAAVTALVFSGIAWAAGSLADRLRNPAVQCRLNQVSAVIFVLLAGYALAG